MHISPNLIFPGNADKDVQWGFDRQLWQEYSCKNIIAKLVGC